MNTVNEINNAYNEQKKKIKTNNNDQNKKETVKTCLYCDKILSTKQRLDSHLKICKKSQQIIFLKEEITRLKEIPIIITINNTDNSTNKSIINNSKYLSEIVVQYESFQIHI